MSSYLPRSRYRRGGRSYGRRGEPYFPRFQPYRQDNPYREKSEQARRDSTNRTQITRWKHPRYQAENARGRSTYSIGRPRTEHYQKIIENSPEYKSQEDIEELLTRLRESRDPELLEQVLDRMNREAEQTEAKPQVENEGRIFMSGDEIEKIDSVFERAAEQEREEIDSFFQWIEQSTSNSPETTESESELSLGGYDVPYNELELLFTESEVDDAAPEKRPEQELEDDRYVY